MRRCIIVAIPRQKIIAEYGENSKGRREVRAFPLRPDFGLRRPDPSEAGIRSPYFFCRASLALTSIYDQNII